jgi:hypothetical protein
MAVDYSIEVCRALEETFYSARLFRPMRIQRYDQGKKLNYAITGVEQNNPGHIRLKVEKFIGGGFAGQVYQVRVMDLKTPEGPIGTLKKGGLYALKILVPPSTFSRLFRNILYWLGFQGAFQLQVNPSAVRAGALWQKFFRRGAELYFGDASMVNNIHATLIDERLGSCGEISDFVDGRTWRLEVDDQLDVLKRFKRGLPVNLKKLGSPEYRAKKKFMAEFVRLLHDMGGIEFARQYEWWTCKSQPNCLKRHESDKNPEKGLVAVDFRAGLVLLPFLPMSPVDFLLILRGFTRGSLVQFDRGNIQRLENFIRKNKKNFSDMSFLLEELKKCEAVYRDSTPAIFHNHLRLIFSKRLWRTMLNSTRTGWRIRNLIDAHGEKKCFKAKPVVLIFALLGIIPILGRFFKKVWGHAGWRKHYCHLLKSMRYVKRSVRGKCAEKAMVWYRGGRIGEVKALKMPQSLGLFLLHFFFSILPVKLHRFLTDWAYMKDRFSYIIVRPVRLYFSSDEREQWLRDLVSEGQKKQILGDEDARIIHSQIKEPFIQKYLKSLAVHICTLPVTQIVSIIVSWIYVTMHPELSTAEAMAAVAAILVLFQITPISPGSLVRGLYVVYLVIKEKNFRDYNIAVILGFFKYIGYLAFPIQMTYRYPALARFMAGHWATEAVHIIPVFGERGALLERWVFDLFYNWPLTIRRRMRKIADLRTGIKPRYWHLLVIILLTATILGAVDFFYIKLVGEIPHLKNIWWVVIFLTLISGSAVTRWCGGASIGKRVLAAAVCGAGVALFYTLASAVVWNYYNLGMGDLLVVFLWRLFIFTLFFTIGAILTEIRLPDPDLISGK